MAADLEPIAPGCEWPLVGQFRFDDLAPDSEGLQRLRNERVIKLAPAIGMKHFNAVQPYRKAGDAPYIPTELFFSRRCDNR